MRPIVTESGAKVDLYVNSLLVRLRVEDDNGASVASLRWSEVLGLYNVLAAALSDQRAKEQRLHPSCRILTDAMRTSRIREGDAPHTPTAAV